MSEVETASETDTQEPVVKARTKSKSFATILKSGDNMSSGIVEHSEILSPKGLNDAYVEALNTLIGECRVIDNEQEILKGQLKEKTTALQDKAKELRDALGYCGAIVKRVMPQIRWVDFGITAKK